MKAQPSFFLLAGVVTAGALLLGCEGGIDQLSPGNTTENELIAAYVDPVTPAPGAEPTDRDRLPVLDGDAQDREWQVAQPLFVYVSGDQGFGGAGFYVELRAIWSDEARIGAAYENHLYMLIRYGDETFDIFPDYWRYAQPGQLGLVPSPTPLSPGQGRCDSVIVNGSNWYLDNAPTQEDQISLAFQIEPARDDIGTFDEIGCQVACHAAGGKAFGGVPQGKLDIWTWRAGRTNAQESTIYPDLGSPPDEETGRLPTQFPRSDPTTAWPGYMEDMWLDASGFHSDQAEGRSFFDKNGYTGYLYVRNESRTNSRDGLPIPSHITEIMKEPPRSTGGPAPEVVPPNDGLPPTFYLWGPTARTFTACESLATSRLGATYRNWSDRLVPGETDVMPGYLLWLPNGSAADVRAKGDFIENPAKRFPVWAVEARRAMKTGHDDDVLLEPDKEYTFSIAIFNRSSQIHSGSGPLKLRFQPSKYTKPRPAGGQSR